MHKGSNNTYARGAKKRGKQKASGLAYIVMFILLAAAAVSVGFAVFTLISWNSPPSVPGYTPVAHVLAAEPDADPADYIPAYDEYEEAVPVFAPAAYTQLPFFIPDNADLYAAFQYERPDLDMETVIWMVNVSLHVPFFSYIQTNYQPNPLFVSPQFRLPPGFSPPDMVPVNNDNCHLRATLQTVEAFHAFRAAAQASGFDLFVTSAYRTAVRQNELWTSRGQVDGSTARPYHSEHQTGRALDLWGPGGLLDIDGPSPTGEWVAQNAHYFGFIVRYGAETAHITGYIHEPWHITYVGVEIATYMHENNILSLEEFVGRNPGAAIG